jgi:hypothetical protein
MKRIGILSEAYFIGETEFRCLDLIISEPAKRDRIPFGNI